MSGDRSWWSAIHKEPRDGPVWLGKTNLDGDGQADPAHHGGPDKAVNAYPVEHYSHWQQVVGRDFIPYGSFGENFTTQGLVEQEACIGDMYSVGQAVVQVSQPRQPCWKLSRRWGIREFAGQVEQTGFTGWYFRVLQEGMVETGMSMELLERPFPTLTITLANDMMSRRSGDRDLLRTLAACPALSESWKAVLAGRVTSSPHLFRKAIGKVNARGDS